MEEMYLKKSSTTLTPNNNNNCFLLSSSPVKLEEVSPNMMEKQGIISVLGADDCRGSKPDEATSFRRTLSADMSSKTWLAQNGFRHPTMKKIASSGQLAIISTVVDSSSEKNKKQDDVWGTIISQKKSDEIQLPPYVHPLLKKSNSTLSEKSLELCTENLGSETGSDGFSSSEANSEASDLDKEEESRHEEIKNYLGEELPVVVAKYNYSATADKKMMQKHRSFPPPLSSLTPRSNAGPCLHMHSQRVNGRLVLQAVAVPSTKNFQAQREDGRLRLTLLSKTPEEKDEERPVFDGAVADQKADDIQVEEDLEEMSEIFKEDEDENNAQTDDEEEEEEEEMSGQVEEKKGSVMKLEAPKMKSGTINVHRSALMMKKLEAIENQNSTWSDNFNYRTPAKIVEDAMTKETTLLPQSLPPRPRATRIMPGTQAATAAAASYNSYEYFWRAKPATTGLKNEISQPVTTILTKQLTRPATTNLKNQITRHCSPYSNNTSNGVIAVLKPKEYEHKEIAVLRNCKEARKSLLFWDAHCIATS